MKMESIKYTLIHPFQVGEETITELNFIKPQVKHLKKLDGVVGDVTKTAKMIEVCANIPPSTVDEIYAEDLTEIAKVVEGFF